MSTECRTALSPNQEDGWARVQQAILRTAAQGTGGGVRKLPEAQRGQKCVQCSEDAGRVVHHSGNSLRGGGHISRVRIRDSRQPAEHGHGRLPASHAHLAVRPLHRAAQERVSHHRPRGRCRLGQCKF